MEALASENVSFMKQMIKNGAKHYKGMAEPLIAYLATWSESGASQEIPEVASAAAASGSAATSGGVTMG